MAIGVGVRWGEERKREGPSLSEAPSVVVGAINYAPPSYR